MQMWRDHRRGSSLTSVLLLVMFRCVRVVFVLCCQLELCAQAEEYKK